MLRGIIEKRVMAVIKEKIKNAEQRHAEESKELVEEFDRRITALGDELHDKKEKLIDKHVEAIIGKIM